MDILNIGQPLLSNLSRILRVRESFVIVIVSPTSGSLLLQDFSGPVMLWVSAGVVFSALEVVSVVGLPRVRTHVTEGLAAPAWGLAHHVIA